MAVKIIVTSLGETIESPIDKRFGCARYFILYDLDSGTWSAHDNEQIMEASGETGIREGRKAVEMGASAVITGHCGPKPLAILTANGIDVYQEAEGTVGEAIDALKRGKLRKTDKPGPDS